MEHLDRLRQQLANQRVDEQAAFHFLQRCEVRRLVKQAEQLSPQRPVVENRDDASVIGAKELAQLETGEQLSEFIIVATESMTLPWQCPVPNGHRDRRHLPW